MLVPGANVDAVGILLNKRLTQTIGKGTSPIVFRNERPIVVFSEQGVTPAKNDNVLVPTGAGNLQADGPNNANQSFSLGSANEHIQENKPRKIGHVIITLDVSSSMKVLSGASDHSSKLEHIQKTIRELIDNGISKGTKATLIIYNENAKIATYQQTRSFRQASEKPIEFTSDLETLFQAIQSLRPGGGTNFYNALELACEKVAQYNPDKSNPETPLFIFITDGQDGPNSGKAEVLAMARNLRKLNAHSLIIGTGKDYDEKALRELTTELGPAMCVHTPHPNPRINVFGLFAPTFTDDIRNPHYMSIAASGFSPDNKFFDLIPTIREASHAGLTGTVRSPSSYRMYTGYQSKGIGIGFVREEKLENAILKLRLQNHASGNIEHTADIPIIPFDDAGAYHEYKEEAEDLLARLLSFLSQREWDADAFDKIVKDFPHSFSPDEARSISQSLRSFGSIDANEVRGSVSEASMSASIFTMRGYRNSMSQSPGEHSGNLAPINVPPESIGSFKAPALGKYRAHNQPVTYSHFSFQFPPSSVKISGENKFSLNSKQTIKIGRDDLCEVQLLSEKTNPIQCFIKSKDGILTLININKKTNVYVNEKLVTESIEVKNNDLIRIGNTTIQLSFQ